MTKVYYDDDADLAVLDGKTVGIIGYGNQGRSQGLNLRDSGVSVIVGGIRDHSLSQAKEDGFETYPVAESIRQASVVLLLVPDEVQRQVYATDIEPNLKAGKTLVFAHGYNIRYELIQPPANVDVVLVAPRMVGAKVRELFEAGGGGPAYVGVHRDATGRVLSTALAKGIGATRVGAIEQTFAQETELDLFMEQGVWAAVFRVFIESFEVLTDAGFEPEVVAMELYGSKEAAEVMNLMADVGFVRQMNLHSQTSQYGSLSRGPKMLGRDFKERLTTALDQIKGTAFVREWADEQKRGYPRFKKLKEAAQNHPINTADDKLRAILSHNK